MAEMENSEERTWKMKKRIFLVIGMIMIMALVTGCMSVSGSKLEAMFGIKESDTHIQPTGSDTVTVSREEYEFYKNGYERYEKFSELADLYDAAEDYFYWDPDEDKLIEYAAKGLMAGLEDPYSYYYTPEEYAQMWEDDEGNYVGIGVLISSNQKTQICTISRVFKGSPA